MGITEIIKNGMNVQLVVNSLDLKEAFLQWENEQKQNVQQQASEEKYWTADEVAARLNVTKSTLWRWDKIGYLKTVKVGYKVRYTESSIQKILKQK
jgi:excisionase family DNA binding protein